MACIVAGTVEFPKIDLTVFVLPQKVGLAVGLGVGAGVGAAKPAEACLVSPGAPPQAVGAAEKLGAHDVLGLASVGVAPMS